MDIKTIYESIMAELRSLPQEIGVAEQRQAQLVEAAGGWSSMGKNEGERGMALTATMNRRGMPTMLETRKRFDSAVSQASLTTAMLRYLSTQCVEDAPQDFDIDTTGADVQAAVNGTGNPEPGLFEEFGL